MIQLLGNALGLSGASIDTAFDVPAVDFSAGITDMTFGDDASMEWASHDWARTWVHIRRVQEGQPVEGLNMCRENDTTFEIDEAVGWIDEALPASDVEVYVAFEHREVQQLSSGEIVEVLNRAVAVPCGGRLIVTSPAIVVFGLDSNSFPDCPKNLFNHSVEVIWASTLDREQLNSINCSILLYAVQTSEDYERAYEMNRIFEDAIMFLIAEQHSYDAFEARNIGAVGAFFKPLHISRIYERIVGCSQKGRRIMRRECWILCMYQGHLVVERKWYPSFQRHQSKMIWKPSSKICCHWLCSKC